MLKHSCQCTCQSTHANVHVSIHINTHIDAYKSITMLIQFGQIYEFQTNSGTVGNKICCRNSDLLIIY